MLPQECGMRNARFRIPHSAFRFDFRMRNANFAFRIPHSGWWKRSISSRRFAYGLGVIPQSPNCRNTERSQGFSILVQSPNRNAECESSHSAFRIQVWTRNIHVQITTLVETTGYGESSTCSSSLKVSCPRRGNSHIRRGLHSLGLTGSTGYGESQLAQVP